MQFCAVSVWTGKRDCVSEVLSVFRASSKRVFCCLIQPGSHSVEEEGRERAVSCLLASSSLAVLVVGGLWKQLSFQFPQWNDHGCSWRCYGVYSLCASLFFLYLSWFYTSQRDQRIEGCLPICMSEILSFFSFILLSNPFLLQGSCFTLRYSQIYGLICLTGEKGEGLQNVFAPIVRNSQNWF